MKLASFDIFDTTLIRKCGIAQNIFYLLANELYPHDESKANAFYRWRILAEQNASKAYRREVTLADIYSSFDVQGFNEFAKDIVIEKELALEYNNLLPNPEIISLIESKRQEGFKIIFISDMYLPVSFIEDVLTKKVFTEDCDEIFVSCEYNARKSDGALFKIIENRYKPSSWYHWGDNEVSDYSIPRRKFRIKATKVNTDFSKIERACMTKYANYNSAQLISVLVGLQRASRLYLGNNDFAEIGSDYVGSLYLPYVLHVLQESQKRGIKRLYFLSRDSYILFKSAQIFRHQYSDIELRYLFVSRKSLLLPCLIDFTYSELVESFGVDSFYNGGITINHIVKTLKLNIQDVMSAYGDTNVGRFKSIDDEHRFCDFLLKEYKPLKEIGNTENILMVKYLKQEGMFDHVVSAIVDIGFLGTTRLLLNRILRFYNQNDLFSFYLSVYQHALPYKLGPYDSYFNTYLQNRSLLLEQYFSLSPYQSVYGYKEDNGMISPLFLNTSVQYKKDIVYNNIKSILLQSTWIQPLLSNSRLDKVINDWGAFYIQNLETFSVKTNCNPFLSLKDCEGSSKEKNLVKKMSLLDAFKFIVGYDITSWDKGSLYYSFGRKYMGIFTKCRNTCNSIKIKTKKHAPKRMMNHLKNFVTNKVLSSK